MLKKLIRSEMAWVGGGMGCSCCCKRNPPDIRGYGGVWAGYVDHPCFCLNICNNRKDSLGYMSCIDKDKGSWLGCSTLNNSNLAAQVDDYRTEYPTIYLGIDTKKMRELDTH